MAFISNNHTTTFTSQYTELTVCDTLFKQRNVIPIHYNYSQLQELEHTVVS